MCRTLLLIPLVLVAALLMQSPAQALPIGEARITFNTAAADGFALDNLATDFTTLVFTEVPLQPANGLTVNGITFGYSGTFANYNSAFGPGGFTFVDSPVLEGNNDGILTLSFAQPTKSLSFGLALSRSDFTGVGATVELFTQSMVPIGGPLPVNVIPLVFSPTVSFPEGAFSFVHAPEPSTILLFAVGLVLLTMMRLGRESA